MKTPRRRFVLFMVVVALWLAGVPVSADSEATLAIVGQDYTLEEGEHLEGDLLVLGGMARLMEGSVVKGNVVTVGGQTAMAGSVLGDVVAVGGSVEMASTALIEGDLVVFGRVRRHPDATVRGNTIEGLEAARRFSDVPRMWNGRIRPVPTPPTSSKPDTTMPPGSRPRSDQVPTFSSLARVVATMVAALFLAALVVALLPQHLALVIDAMGEAWLLCCGIGLLTIVVVLILIPVLVIICLGIPVAIVLTIALLLSLLMGLTAAGKLLGDKLLKALGAGARPPLIGSLLGTLLIILIATVRCVGPALAAVVGAWGVGAVVLTRFGSTSLGAWTPTAETPSPVPHDPSSAATPATSAAAPPTRARDTKRLDRPLPPAGGPEAEPPPQN